MIHAWTIPLWLVLAAASEHPIRGVSSPAAQTASLGPAVTATTAATIEGPTPLPDVGDEDEAEGEDEAGDGEALEAGDDNDDTLGAGDEAEVEFGPEPGPEPDDAFEVEAELETDLEAGAGDEAEITFGEQEPAASGATGRSSHSSSSGVEAEGASAPSTSPDEGSGANKKDKKKHKKYAFEVHGRVMAGGEVDNKRPSEEQDATPGVGRELFLRQARLKVRVDYKKIFRVKMSIELADALKTPKIDRVAFLRNAYGDVRFHDTARLRFGYFKRPFSRLELRGPSRLPFRGRGLANDRIVEDRNYGDRSVGGMLHGKIRPARLHYSAGVFAPALRTDGIDVVGRVQANPLEWLSIGAGGLYKRVENGTGDMVDVAGASADVRIKYKGLYVLGDLVMGRDYLVPGEPWSLGIVGYASYDVDLPKKLVLQPVLLAEWADIDIGISQNDAVRTIAGVNLVWRKRFRVMPQAEFIRPLGVTGNPWVNKDTYYLMLSLQL